MRINIIEYLDGTLKHFFFFFFFFRGTAIRSLLGIFAFLKLLVVAHERSMKTRGWWILVCRTTIYIKSIRRYIVALFIPFARAVHAAKRCLRRINQLSAFFHCDRMYMLRCANTRLRACIAYISRKICKNLKWLCSNYIGLRIGIRNIII